MRGWLHTGPPLDVRDRPICPPGRGLARPGANIQMLVTMDDLVGWQMTGAVSPASVRSYAAAR
jgi:hypothetical protein